MEHLCTNMCSDKEQLRDISSIGLKTVISELPLNASNMAASVSCVCVDTFKILLNLIISDVVRYARE